MTTWYYARDGKQFGPHTEEELRQMLAEGKLGSGEMIWKAGLPSWVPAHTVFAPPLPAGGPPPPPPAGAGSLQPQYAPQQGQPQYAPQQAQPQYAPQQQYGAAPARKERLPYILLGVFLGVLGVHNFYAGYTGRGLAQLLITLLAGWLVLPVLAVWVWTIVEVVTVTQDAKGVPFS